MPDNQSFSKRLRLGRLHRHGDERLLVVPLDHAVSSGPIVADGGLVRLVGQLVDNNVDAVVLHKGSLRHLDHRWFTRTALIVHLSASTADAPDPALIAHAATLAADLGADIVKVPYAGSVNEMADIVRIEEAVHQRVDAIVSDDLADLATLPPTTAKVLFLSDGELPDDLSGADVVILDAAKYGEPARYKGRHPDVEFGRFVEVVGPETLDMACEAAQRDRWSVLWFRDPTRIPLEIALAAAETKQADLELVELGVTGISRVGMGDRAAVDTCTHFREDEGILVGSHSKGMILCCSETHPLPYMATRPFRVNAGAIHSYTVAPHGRTNYLSELEHGKRVLAVDAKGGTRIVTVGRVKIESRPLLAIDAVAPSGLEVNLIVQDDWHVRVLGPGGVVLNATELKAGDKVLGYLPTEERHVGYPIDEFCIEK